MKALHLTVIIVGLWLVVIVGMNSQAGAGSWEDLGACFSELKGWSEGEVTGLTVQQDGQNTTYATREYRKGDAVMAIKFQTGPSLTKDALTTTFPDTLQHCLMQCAVPCSGPCKCGPVVGEVNGYRMDTVLNSKARLVTITVMGTGDIQPVLTIEGRNMTECEVKKLASALNWGCFYSRAQGLMR
ncbi:MAG: hypothetical protein ABWK15_07585 [Dissulfuribacterales bacterium]